MISWWKAVIFLKNILLLLGRLGTFWLMRYSIVSWKKCSKSSQRMLIILGLSIKIQTSCSITWSSYSPEATKVSPLLVTLIKAYMALEMRMSAIFEKCRQTMRMLLWSILRKIIEVLLISWTPPAWSSSMVSVNSLSWHCVFRLFTLACFQIRTVCQSRFSPTIVQAFPYHGSHYQNLILKRMGLWMR